MPTIRDAKYFAVLAVIVACLAAGCGTSDRPDTDNEDQARQARIEAIERLNKNSESIQSEIRIFIGRYEDVRNVGRIVLSPTDAMILGQTQPGLQLGAKAQEEIVAFVVRKYAEVGIDLNPLRVTLTFIPYRLDSR